jgi:hypothetical protein
MPQRTQDSKVHEGICLRETLSLSDFIAMYLKYKMADKEEFSFILCLPLSTQNHPHNRIIWLIRKPDNRNNPLLQGYKKFSYYNLY